MSKFEILRTRDWTHLRTCHRTDYAQSGFSHYEKHSDAAEEDIGSICIEEESFGCLLRVVERRALDEELDSGSVG